MARAAVEADLIINLHGSHRPTKETAGPGRLIYVETDPGEVEIDVFHQQAVKREADEQVEPIDFGELSQRLGWFDIEFPV